MNGIIKIIKSGLTQKWHYQDKTVDIQIPY